MSAIVIIPTFNHGPTINFSLRSVLAQTYQDFQVYVIGDGTTDETRQLMKSWQKRDARIHFVDKPKSPRNGEPYRHELLTSLKLKPTDFVCYLADDDMWFPDHLALMAEALKTHDFVHSFPMCVLPDQTVGTWYGRLDQPLFVRKLLHSKNLRYNFIPLGAAGHTIRLYRRLPFGWRTTPKGKTTDLHMWQQVLRLPRVKTTRIEVPTLFHLPSSVRQDVSLAGRLKELAFWEKRLAQPNARLELMAALAHSTYDYVLRLQSTKTWQLHDWLEMLAK
jgi:glycosyltransferase involved in cell wall biosynthesis